MIDIWCGEVFKRFIVQYSKSPKVKTGSNSLMLTTLKLLQYTFLEDLDSYDSPLVAQILYDFSPQSSFKKLLFHFHGKKRFYFIQSQTFAILEGRSVIFGMF